MKKYTAIFNRYNPQLGTSKRTYTIEARTLASATKKAEKMADNCLYGSMSLVSVELAA